MKKAQLPTLLVLALFLFSLKAIAGDLIFSKQEFAQRRSNLMESIPDGIAIIRGADLPTGYSLYSQNNDFMYFTGVNIPGAVLIMDGKTRESTIFFTISETVARGEGIDMELVNNTTAATGIEHVAPYEAFTPALNRFSRTHAVFYTSFLPQEVGREAATEKLGFLRSQVVMNEWDGRLTREQQFARLLKERFPNVEVKDCAKAIIDLRVIKSPAEIEVMKKAGALGVKALTEAMRATRVGMYEYEVAGIFEYYCKKGGARDIAYNTIISSDENHPYLHYYKHDRLLKDGDFLVIDAGPDVDYYDTDITISYPANGKFTPRQREFYTACYEIQEACKRFLKAGRTRTEVGKLAREYLISKGIDVNHRDYQALSRGLDNGAITHYVGMAVHDSGGGPADMPFQAGMVIAIDVYSGTIDENMGVRVEDTVLITEEGCENLSPGMARTIEDIEALMKQDGVAQALKDKGIY